MAKQTPYRYSADAKEIIRNTHDFCKREKEDGHKISLNQVKERASTAIGVSKCMIERVIPIKSPVLRKYSNPFKRPSMYPIISYLMQRVASVVNIYDF